LKQRLPLSTCCSWLHEGWHDDWSHIQYSGLIDAGLAFYLSSDIFNKRIEQLTGSFYAGLFGHQTARSFWISSDGQSATTISLGNWFAWGEYGTDNGN